MLTKPAVPPRSIVLHFLTLGLGAGRISWTFIDSYPQGIVA